MSPPVYELHQQADNSPDTVNTSPKRARLSQDAIREVGVDPQKAHPMSVAALRQRANSSSVDYILGTLCLFPRPFMGQ